mgnify:CR=1 FL=1
MPDQYIGEKKVASVTDTGTRTPSGSLIKLVTYEDGTKELFSSLMLDKIISETSCDLTALREKRLIPVVETLLKVLLDWGIKLSELSYMSLLLSQSLDFNQKEALLKLWNAWGPKLQSPDDVDLITMDKVLKAQTIDEAIANPTKDK